MTLSILCVTQAEPYSLPFLRSFTELARSLGAECVLVADGPQAFEVLQREKLDARIFEVKSQGFIESVLDLALGFCEGDYILRMDDDEKVSVAMEMWLQHHLYLQKDHWSFFRFHLWPDTASMLMVPQLFPDHQTRLSVREKSGGRHGLHAPSPFGGGTVAPVAIEHHKFLVKSYEERQQTSQKWHNGNMLAFSLPENVFETVRVVAAGGGMVPWTPLWVEERRMRA